MAELMVSYIARRTQQTPESVRLTASAFVAPDGEEVKTARFASMTEAWFSRVVTVLESWQRRLGSLSDAELDHLRTQGDDATLAPQPGKARRRKRAVP